MRTFLYVLFSVCTTAKVFSYNGISMHALMYQYHEYRDINVLTLSPWKRCGW